MWLYVALGSAIGIFGMSKIRLNYAGTSMSILDIISLYTISRFVYTREHRNISTIVQLDKHHYELLYKIHGKKYRMTIRPRWGPKPICQVLNEKGEDVTETILEHAGPEFNWHGSIFTPKNLGHKRLDIELVDGTVTVYQENDQILGKY